MTRYFIRLAAIARRCALALFALSSPAFAQTPDDGMMMPNRTLSYGIQFSRDSWNQYWEGTLKRGNDNIGTFTTESAALMAGYGINDRIGVSLMVPYIRTEASQGVLRGMEGIQDLTITAKLRLLTTPFTEKGHLSAFLSGSAAAPVGDYSPDLPPVSIGTAGRRAAARFTLGFQSKNPFFASASAAYTFCANVRLDRPAYYTGGQLHLSNEVAMPNVAEFTARVGYRFGKLTVPVTLVQQRTQGGGDIRRQDMPFISNRMDFRRLDVAAMYELPKDLTLRLGAGRVLNGRNVGQATSLSLGVSHAIGF